MSNTTSVKKPFYKNDGFVTASKRTCFGCGKTGHIHENCPNKKEKTPLTCSFCKEVGHHIKNCTVLENTICSHCGDKGHTVKKCPIPIVCSFCNKEGHFVEQCDVLYNTQCTHCYRYGHIADMCDQEPTFKMTHIACAYLCDWCHKREGVRVVEHIATTDKQNLCGRCLNRARANFGIVEEVKNE